MRMKRFVVVQICLVLLCSCSRSPLTVSPALVPDSGPSVIRLTGLPLGLAVAQYDGQPLDLQRDGADYRVVVPQRPPGRYLLVVDDYEAAIEVKPGRLQVSVLDVGQGDATLIKTPAGQTILVDSGPPEAVGELRAALQRHGVTALDWAIATHMDADHIGGFAGLVAGADGQVGTFDDLKVQRWRDSGDAVSCTSQACADYRAVANGREQIEPADDLELLGGFEMKVLARAGEVMGRGTVPATGDRPASTADDNARSVVLLLQLNDFKMLMMGDLTGGGLSSPDVEALLAPSLGRVTVLRAGHHGSRTSSSGAFVAATAPQVSLLSYGEDNRHCHPVEDVVARLASVGWVYGTNRSPSSGCPSWSWPERGADQCGEIRVQTAKGRQFTVECAGQSVTF